LDLSRKSSLLSCFLELSGMAWEGIRDGFSSMGTVVAFTWKAPNLISAQISRGFLDVDAQTAWS